MVKKDDIFEKKAICYPIDDSISNVIAGVEFYGTESKINLHEFRTMLLQIQEESKSAEEVREKLQQIELGGMKFEEIMEEINRVADENHKAYIAYIDGLEGKSMLHRAVDKLRAMFYGGERNNRNVPKN